VAPPPPNMLEAAAEFHVAGEKAHRRRRFVPERVARPPCPSPYSPRPGTRCPDGRPTTSQHDDYSMTELSRCAPHAPPTGGLPFARFSGSGMQRIQLMLLTAVSLTVTAA